ncbi:type IV pilus biogenesis protein PilP [Burkholderia vietnamiensis]|uniref:type IV pilus biogenesis protein PilP n=1 Tax=Burkholderia vietnamiensis TaxID=60552 RepID=UPI000B0CE59A|nr:type IV pilus biogenesis protein PilP [Burkholderia vietnamiensis]MCO1351592.1 type IV pilus biogenesis protein PilP [Burkholderia vietnamiensis]MCO1430216.1 type IV pilus biogenesis protein PilP [Burkholderia vietnamiensis]UQN50951.1 type IV pilus biogenesis protein PilP [Burkholderia vietnamiensis]HDR9036933.1 type IV pilus biogenesis protein PilP [Burkholderia vietnamiensis]HDR9070102.1 type IV pilus biogenesis protein PilP [Burkholderia vietnamiensis]
MKFAQSFAMPIFAIVASLSAHAGPAAAPIAPSTVVKPAAQPDAQMPGAIKGGQPLDVAESDGARLASIQRRIPILEAEKRIAELEKAIRDANASTGLTAIPAGVPAPVGGPPGFNRVPSNPPMELDSGFVEVKGIDSYNGKFCATLAAAGRVDDVHVGDTFAGWRVVKITAADVTVTRRRAGKTETRVVRL